MATKTLEQLNEALTASNPIDTSCGSVINTQAFMLDTASMAWVEPYESSKVYSATKALTGEDVQEYSEDTPYVYQDPYSNRYYFRSTYDETIYFKVPIKGINPYRKYLVGSDALGISNTISAGTILNDTACYTFTDHYKDSIEDVTVSDEELNKALCMDMLCDTGNGIRIDPKYTVTAPNIDYLALVSPKYDKPDYEVIGNQNPDWTVDPYLIPDTRLWDRPEYDCPEIPVIEDPVLTDDCLETRFEDLFKDYDLNLYDIPKVGVSEVTDKTTDGFGSFDWFSDAMLNQLQKAKQLELLHNDDIATVLSQSLLGSMEHAVSFALQRDQAKWQNQATQAQILNAKLQALNLKAELLMLPEKLKAMKADLELKLEQLKLAKYQTEVAKLQIPLTCIQIRQGELNIDATRLQMQQTEAQTQNIENQSVQINVQTDLIKTQVEHQNVAIRQLELQVKHLGISTQTVQNQAVQSEIQNELLRTQVDNSSMDVEVKKANIAQIHAGIENTYAQTKIANANLNLAKAKLKLEKAQAAMVNEQVRAAQAQYKNDVDGNPVGGVIGAQIALHRMQAEAFDRDSYIKFLNVMASGWQTKKTSDIATVSPDQFTAYAVGKAVDIAGQNLFGIPIGTFTPEPDYTDYLSDDQLEGTASTGSVNTQTVSNVKSKSS